MSNVIVGIDLGTTMSVLAYIDPKGLGKPEISKTQEGLHLTPSRICFGDDEIKVGIKNCLNGLLAKEFKRDMGNKEYQFTAYDNTYSPIELSSFVLEKLKNDAISSGLAVHDVVITVPAYFDEIRRSATKKAGELAGLNVVSVINEPTAAALFYALNVDKKVNGKVLVYDLGGGTFDVTIMNLNGSDVDIVASGGNALLGGADFDQLIIEILKEKYIQEVGSGLPYEDDDEQEEFELSAEEIKKILSQDDSFSVKLRGTNGKAKITISRNEFEEKMQNYLQGINISIESVLEEANLRPENIDHILMVGGSTRIPIIKEEIQKLIGKEPITTLDVDESVAKGAALKASMIKVEDNPDSVSSAIRREAEKINISEVATVSFGTITIDSHTDKEKNVIIIGKNTKIPCTEFGTFSTIGEGQTQVDVSITTGESENPKEVTLVDKFTLNLPGGRPSGQPIKITYSYTGDQSLRCIAEDVSTGKTKEYLANKVI